MLTNQIRKEFLNYFQKKNHTIVASSPVVPHEDPTLLFTNAGMNQFKDVFLSKSTRDYKRAASSQKCIRVGGKHNDLENVGHTQRHLTFFEMLGNFSFGDYFKEQAIAFAWEVSTEIFGFDKEKIYPSVLIDDDEAYQIWQRYVPASRIAKMGAADNFWSMGDTGPCGPSSELYYDKGAEFGKATSPIDDVTGNRFLEFWNLVFMQYNRRPDGIQEPLPSPSIDTGAGLERVMSLIQKKESVFETDILRTIIASIEEESKIPYNNHDEKKAAAFRVIADHLRCLAFAIADGVQPSNIERGYVLRKVLRRAVRYGKMLGFDEPFLARILPSLTRTLGQDYKELVIAEKRIAEIMTVEEEAFFKTLRRGGNILNQIIDTSALHKKIISGDDAFKLKDTYGLPLEEIQLIAKDAHLSVDLEGFQQLEKEAKVRSKSAHKTTQQVVEDNLYQAFKEKNGDCLFIRGELQDHNSHVIGLIQDNAFCDTLLEGSDGVIIMQETPFYSEMGGQCGDSGILTGKNGTFSVTNTTSPYKGIICHQGTVTAGTISLRESLTAQVNWPRRQAIANNHTATHLLHWALHKVLGEHAKQAGSVVDEEHLRFDFSHHKAMTPNELKTIEQLINAKIRENLPVTCYEIPYSEAQKRADIKQFFGEKYGTNVRVIDIDFSKELCGGTHTSRTGNIGYFRITKEGSIAAGVRRIEAVTGAYAEAFAYSSEDELQTIAEKLKTPQLKIKERIDKMNEELKHLHDQVKGLKKIQQLQLVSSLLPLIISKNGHPFIAKEIDTTPAELKDIAEEISSKNTSCIIALACISQGKPHFFVKVSQDLIKQGISASALINFALKEVGGKGGGKHEMAQGAGMYPEKIDLALTALIEHL